MTIFPVFLLASMCLWASAMFSRLKELSITGLKGAVWSEKCGNTLREKAFTRSDLYYEGKHFMQESGSVLEQQIIRSTLKFMHLGKNKQR